MIKSGYKYIYKVGPLEVAGSNLIYSLIVQPDIRVTWLPGPNTQVGWGNALGLGSTELYSRRI